MYTNMDAQDQGFFSHKYYRPGLESPVLTYNSTRSVQRGVQRGAFSPTSGATPATPTLGATPKLLSATPKDFVPSEKAKRITISGAAAPSHFGHLIFRNIKVSLTTLNAAGWQLSLTVLSLVASLENK